MLRHILFDVRLFETEDGRKRSQKGLLWLLEALAQWNEIYLRAHPETPRLYQSGVIYKLPEQFDRQEVPEIGRLREIVMRFADRGERAEALELLKRLADQLGGGEHFRDIPAIIENNGGDCDNIAGWRVAELRVAGIPAKPYITWRRRPDNGMTYHAIVLWPDGSSEDPSLLLGMGGDAKEDDREAEREKLAERERRRRRGRGLGRAIARLLAPPIPDVSEPTSLDGEFEAAADRFRARRLRSETILGDSGLGPGFGQGVYYQPVYLSDDAYEDFRPGPPTAFYDDIRLPGVVTPGPFARPGLWQEGGSRFDREEDEDDDLWGDVPPFRPVYRSGMRTFIARTLPRRGKGY